MKKVLLLITLVIVTAFSFGDKTDTNQTDSLMPVEKQLIKIYQNVVPSVVNITNMQLAGSIFGDVEKIPAGMGTGFVWNDKGHIVTNYHVIEGGTEFVVSFFKDKKQYKATIVGAEPRLDVAVLKLQEMPKKLAPVTVGKSQTLQVGQMTIAIGNPFGLDHSMSRGIVSALDRKIKGIGGVKIHGMVQTDAAINQGNSGGPLLNSSGHVIGMNTMIFSPSGANAGLGFAVPIDSIKSVVPQLIEHGKVIRPALGIGILPDQYKEAYFGTSKGVVIRYIDEDGAAYKAGLRGMTRDPWGRSYLGDIILKIDDKEINSYDDIYHALDKYKVGDQVEITYRRKKKVSKIKMKLGSL